MLKFVSRGDAGPSASTSTDSVDTHPASASTSTDPEQPASANTAQQSSASTNTDPGEVKAVSASSSTNPIQPASANTVQTSSENRNTVTDPGEVQAASVREKEKEKRLRNSKRHFSYEAPDEPMTDALKNLEVNFFNIVVDSAVTSMDERFETLNQVKSKYGVLLNFSTASQMSSESLKAHCMEVQNTLTFRDDYDISGMDLAHEIQNLPDLPSDKMTAFELLSFLCEKNLEELYPNLWIALRIAVTLPVTVASSERSFSKLKLIKSYLRSSMSQERLSGLAIMSINHDVGKHLSYDDIIDDFASRKCRKGIF